jgi:uncharacterized membrane protein
MAFCPSCGAASEGRFCAKCGASLAPGAANPSAPPPPPPPPAAAGTGLPENAANALCYILGIITGILFLVMAPHSQNPRTRFHAFQSIFLFLAWFAFYFAIGILAFIVPGFALLIGLLSPLIFLAGFVLVLFLMWKAYQGVKISLPVIGPLAEQQAAKA